MSVIVTQLIINKAFVAGVTLKEKLKSTDKNLALLTEPYTAFGSVSQIPQNY